MIRLLSISAKRSCERKLLPVRLPVSTSLRRKRPKDFVNSRNESKIGRLVLTKLALNVPMSKLRLTIVSRRLPKRRGMSKSYKSYMRLGRGSLQTMIGA